MAKTLKEIVTEHVDSLKLTPLFHGFIMDDLIKFLVNCKQKNIKAGDLIVHEGAQSTTMSILLTGRVGIYKQEMLINTLMAPALIGEIGLFTGTPRNATVKAETDILALSITEAELHAYFQTEPKLTRQLYSNVILTLRNKINNDNQQILSLQAEVIEKEAQNLKLKVTFMPEQLDESEKQNAQTIFAKQKRLSQNKRNNIRVAITQPNICYVNVENKRFEVKDLSLTGLNVYVSDFSDSVVKKWRPRAAVKGEICLLNQPPFPFSGAIRNTFRDHCGIQFNKNFPLKHETVLIGMINALYRLGMVI